MAGRVRAVNLIPAVVDAILAPQRACTAAIGLAEVRHGVPTGLLLAIGRTESGRIEPASGLVQPWPWTIDVGGKGAFFATRSEAVAAVEGLRLQGVQSVDVGCLQVNLQQHPAAFTSLDEAFDPVANADYAAGFLAALHRESGDWSIASGLYHSHTEVLATPYREAVAGQFMKVNGMGMSVLVPPPRPQNALAKAWAATLSPQVTTTLHLWPKPSLHVYETRIGIRKANSLRLSSR